MGEGKKMEKKARKKISDDVARRVQSSLKNAISGSDPQTLFRKYDKDKNGTFEVQEFRRLIRVELKVPPAILRDDDINLLISALDDDGSGSLSIDELVDFVERG